jgi:putative transcriptional regulator
MKFALLVLLLLAAAARAQPTGILLVAKPGMLDPNFRETVIVVTRADDGATVGVILNRPGQTRLAELAPNLSGAQKYRDRVNRGGPVMQQVVVALFASREAPTDAAFEVMPHVYLTLHPRNIEAELAKPDARMRLFSGFAGWAPRQLEAEIADDAWYALRASESILFRTDTTGLWRELVDQASGPRTATDSGTVVGAILVP